MAWDFAAEIHALAGFDADDTSTTANSGEVLDDHADRWLTDGAKEIINVLPPRLLSICCAEQSFTSAAVGSEAEEVDTGKVLAVFAGNYSAREIASGLKHEANNSASMSYATATDPVYYFQNSKINVLPASISCKYEEVQYPTVAAAGTTAIASFPDEAEHLVVLYASIKALEYRMNIKSSDLPSDLTAPVLGIVSSSLPSFTAPSDLITPVKPTVPTISAQSVTITGTAPSYTKPVFSAPSLGSVGALTLPSKPVAPITSAQTVAAFGDEPTYTKPVVSLGSAPTISNLSITVTPPTAPVTLAKSVTFTTTPPAYTSPTVGGATESLTASMSAIDGGQIGTDAEFVNFRYWFTALGEMIEDDEDIELASAQIEKINSYIQTYNIAMQDKLNVFNDAMAEYQAELQISVQNAQLSNQEDTRKVQKFQAEISSYQAQVNKDVHEYQQNLAGDLQVWQAERQTDLQKYGTDIQNELNEFNKENVEYQASIQEKKQEASLADADEARKLQKYQAEISSYQAEVNATIQEWVNEEWAQNFQKYQTDYSNLLQEYQVNVQNELNNFNDANIEYQAKLQKDIQDSQLSDSHESKKLVKYQAEVGEYGAELNANLQVFTSALTKNTASFDTSLQNYQAEANKVLSDNQAKIQLFTGEIGNFTQIIQKNSVDYQWLQSQHAQLKFDYQQGLQFLISGGLPAQQQGE